MLFCFVNKTLLNIKALTHQGCFAVASSVNGKASKKSIMAKRHNAPCFLKFYRSANCIT